MAADILTGDLRMIRRTKNLLRIVGTTAVALFAVGAVAAGLNLSRIALTFEDGTPATIVERDGKLAAQAEISFNGNGLLRAAWEIAGPNPDGGDPTFRKLADVQQPLGGREAVIVKSPSLPTDSNGLYLLRLRVAKPATALESPVIRYNVNEKKAVQEQR